MGSDDREERAPASFGVPAEELEVVNKFRIFVDAFRRAKATRADLLAFGVPNLSISLGLARNLNEDEVALLNILRSNHIDYEDASGLILDLIAGLSNQKQELFDNNETIREEYLMDEDNVRARINNIKKIMNDAGNTLESVTAASRKRSQELRDLREQAEKSLAETRELLDLKIGPE